VSRTNVAVRETVTIQTTDTQFHRLWALLESGRASSETIKIEKAALRALLLDHQELVAPHEKRGTVQYKP